MHGECVGLYHVQPLIPRIAASITYIGLQSSSGWMQPIPMLQVEGVVLEQVHPQHRAARALEVVEPERSVAEVLAVRVAL